jgi:hypothetical protein
MQPASLQAMQPKTFAPMLNRHQSVPQATVPPHPILDVEPVKPVGTPIPFYPIPQHGQAAMIPVSQPVKQKSVSFMDEEEKIQKIMSGGEECQNACSISKILQK